MDNNISFLWDLSDPKVVEQLKVLGDKFVYEVFEKRGYTKGRNESPEFKEAIQYCQRAGFIRKLISTDIIDDGNQEPTSKLVDRIRRKIEMEAEIKHYREGYGELIEEAVSSDEHCQICYAIQEGKVKGFIIINNCDDPKARHVAAMYTLPLIPGKQRKKY